MNHDPRYLRGIELFNKQDYFEAHEVWEELWHATQDDTKDYYQGLIQVTSAMHHLSNGNMKGARILHDSAHDLLGPYRPRHAGLDLDAILADFDRALAEILTPPPSELTGRAHAGPPRIVFGPERVFRMELK